MKATAEHNERMANLTFASVYPHYITKVESKGRNKHELLQVIEWLTGFKEQDLQKHIEAESTFKEFFDQANLNPNAALITGSICGYKIQDIENSLTRHVRYLDKLVDKLAKGKAMEVAMYLKTEFQITTVVQTASIQEPRTLNIFVYK